MSSAWNGSQKLPLDASDILLCMLPLGHVFGFVCGLLWGLSCGAAVALGRGTRHYMDDCRFYQPTALSAVPSLLGFLLAHEGLNESLRLILIGAGDCPADLLSAVQARNIRVSFGYGLTETSSGVAITRDLDDPYALAPCPDADIRIEADGEVSVKTPCLMKGYIDFSTARPGVQAKVSNPAIDGRLYTGDLGFLDERGYLHLTGRKKDMLITSYGKNINCTKIEQRLMDIPGVEQAVLVGEQRPYCTALLWTSGTIDTLAADIERMNAQLSHPEQVKRFCVIQTPLSISRGELTPSLKVKRNVVLEHYTQEIDKLYS
jgi:long-subunit acyl-CoA synthetase (AMP-forming)